MRSGTTLALGAAALCLLLGACGDGSDGGQAAAGGSAREAPPPPASDPLAGSGAPTGTSAASAQDAVEGEGAVIRTMGWSIPVPAGWQREEPAGSMRAAQYTIPGEGGAAEFVLFRGIGGGVEPNILRWIGQVSDYTMDPERETRTLDGGLKVHIVEMVGTYQVGQMMGGSGMPESDTRFVGLVLEGGPQGDVFIRVVGPNATLEPRADEIEAMIQGIGPA